MPDAPHELHYADGRRRWKRKLTMLALIASAIACGLVGRLLYHRLAPQVSAWLALSDAQRGISNLIVHGSAFDADASQWPATPDAKNHLDKPASAYLLARDGALINPGVDTVLFAGRIQNLIGERRFIIVRIARSGMILVGSGVDTATLIVDTARGASLSDGAVAKRTDFLQFTTFRTLHLEPPVIDPANPRRMLINGTINGAPFERELTIDANDRAQLHDLPAPTTRSAP